MQTKEREREKERESKRALKHKTLEERNREMSYYYR